MQTLTSEQLLSMLENLPQWQNLISEVKELKEKVLELENKHPNNVKLLEEVNKRHLTMYKLKNYSKDPFYIDETIYSPYIPRKGEIIRLDDKRYAHPFRVKGVDYKLVDKYNTEIIVTVDDLLKEF